MGCYFTSLNYGIGRRCGYGVKPDPRVHPMAQVSRRPAHKPARRAAVGLHPMAKRLTNAQCALSQQQQKTKRIHHGKEKQRRSNDRGKNPGGENHRRQRAGQKPPRWAEDHEHLSADSPSSITRGRRKTASILSRIKSSITVHAVNSPAGNTPYRLGAACVPLDSVPIPQSETNTENETTGAIAGKLEPNITS